MTDGHRTAELRSIELHRLVAERLDEAMLARTRERLRAWLVDGRAAPTAAARAWLELLDAPPETVRSRLVEDSERMRDLRQNTPFAGVVPPLERWRVLREIR